MKKYLFFCAFFIFTMAYSQEFIDAEKIGITREITELDSLIKTFPTAENYYYRGYFNYETQNYFDALADYNKALELEPNNFNYNFSRGNLKLKLKDYTGAIADFSNCISLHKNSYKAYFNSAFAKSKIKDYKGAIAYYTKSITINTEYALAYQNRGLLKKETGLYQEALLDFNKARTINPEFVAAIQESAVAKAMLNQKEALEDFDKLVTMSPQNPEAYFNRALYFINFKIKRDYCSDLKKAMELGYAPAAQLLIEKCKK